MLVESSAFCPSSLLPNLRPAARSSLRQSVSSFRPRFVPASTSTRPNQSSFLTTKCVATSNVSAPAESTPITKRDDVVTVAFVAHIDHGKSSMCDALLKGAACFRENEHVEERVMDGMDLEKERGITINASAASLVYNGVNVQILDTPGHADFGGEVERVLNMADGVLLLVDSVEGPKPQTRFVLKKAIELNKKISLIINKMDRPQARPDYVVDSTFDLMAELGATDEQMDFDIAYASAINGQSGCESDCLEDNMDAIFDLILKFPRPEVALDAPLQLQVNNVTYDDFKGRLVSGRVHAGVLRKGQSVVVCHPDKDDVRGKVAEIFVYDKLGRASVEQGKAGDIVMFSGLSKFEIGDTVCSPDAVNPLPPISVEEPTVRMAFMVNTSEFAGQEGKYVTSRNIRDRLDKELERNVGLKLDLERSTPECIEVCGRGALHLTILIETMRREGFEFMVGPPTVITKEVDGAKLEPYEQFEVEVPEEYMGSVVDLLGRRKGEMINMAGANSENMASVTYLMPTRGLLGVKNALLTATRGTAVMNSQFDGYRPFAGQMENKENGSLVVYETGRATTYGLEAAQDRGRLLIKPGEKVYKNQICGIYQRPGDLAVNICKVKALTNYRSATKEIKTGMQGLLEFSLDDAIEYIGHDEVVEVTPESVRLSKRASLKKRKK
ncbi:GTP-binding protein of TypA family [Gracilaria domingensis]|nr:GTP-binding protein of TypA family [Gracilaria domingensis]